MSGRPASFGCVPADRWASSLEDEAATRLAVILEWLQSVDIYAEAIADSVAGPTGWWSAVAGLELWKAACRLRLLALQPRERLMRSLLSEEEEAAAAAVDEEGFDDGHSSPKGRPWPPGTPPRSATGGSRRARWSPGLPPVTCSPTPIASGAEATMHRIDRVADSLEGFVCRLVGVFSPSLAVSLRARLSGGAPALLALGEALHIAQPLAHLVMRLTAMPRRRQATTEAARPRRATHLLKAWLCALAIELAAYALCRRAATLAQRSETDRAAGYPAGGCGGYNGTRGNNGSTSLGVAAPAGVAHNEEELRHRKRLLQQLLVRPVVLAMVRAGVSSLVPRGATAGSARGGCGIVAVTGRATRWAQRALELIDSIDAVQPRYSGSGG